MRRAACADGAASGALRHPKPSRWHRALLCALALLFIASVPAQANDRIEVSHAELRPTADGDGIELNATFEFQLPWALEDAVNRGVALYFVVDFELYRARWYWFDRRVISTSITYRLAYSPLTRQYRLGRGTLALPFDSLNAALLTLRRVSNWKVADADMLKADEDYRAQVRMRLDTSQLPRPFQVGALTNRDWTLTSEWHEIKVVPEALR